MNFVKLFSLLLVTVFACAEDFSVQQSIVFSVPPCNQVGNIGGPSPVFSDLRGLGASRCSNTYDVFTNGENKKIIGFLDANMPKHTCLEVYLAPPSGARTMGPKMLSTVPVDLVIEISRVSETGLALIYNFETSPGVGVIESDTRVVTFTMTDG